MKENKTYNDEYVSMEMKDGILYFGFQPDSTVTLDIARKVVQTRYEFCDGDSVPVLIQDAGMRAIEKDARDFLSGPEGMLNIAAGALLATNTFNRFLGNFFLNITKRSSKVPVQMFEKREDAIKWLEQFK